MRIAYICQSYPPMVSGAALFVKRLAEEMNARGHSILVISASEKGMAEICQSERFKHVKLRSLKNPLRVGQTFTLWSRNTVFDHLKQFTPDLIHVHDAMNLGILGLKYAQATNTSAILTLHQLPRFVATYFPDFPGVRKVVKNLFWSYGDWLLRNYDHTIVPSHTIAEEVSAKIDKQSIVISYGIDLRRFSPDPERAGERTYLCKKYGLDASKPIILHVGRLDKDKNMTSLIRAAGRALAQVDGQLLVVGDGCHRKTLEALCSELGISGRAFFPGFINQEGDLPALYRLATVFAMASLVETQGIVILEALSSSVPVVAFQATCIHELVQDSINGYLVQSGDVDEMGDLIAKLLSCPAQASEMGRVGRDLVKIHAINNTFEKHERLYQDVIRAKRSFIKNLQLASLR